MIVGNLTYRWVVHSVSDSFYHPRREGGGGVGGLVMSQPILAGKCPNKAYNPPPPPLSHMAKLKECRCLYLFYVYIMSTDLF